MNHTYSKLRAPLRSSLLPLAVALVLAGCASSAIVDTSQVPAAPAAFKEVTTAVTVSTAASQAQGMWWTVFADPVLDGLIAEANGNNNSVQVAAGRLAQARALAFRWTLIAFHSSGLAQAPHASSMPRPTTSHKR